MSSFWPQNIPPRFAGRIGGVANDIQRHISAGDAADASQSPETVTLAQKMLSWIVSAVEPMKVQHLQVALALREGKCQSPNLTWFYILKTFI
ncbi:hypothetical protein BJX68DRAFT_239999 [Aspergillus pseudodeflectus]|uniref:Uncharacterized protein n=1 Tax=Aspergillus pseudodeflectus TaxID=176178 RepID=A0ABR4K6H5_9EURO